MSVLEMKVPSPGESISEVEIAAWLVEDGDYVQKDQTIAEVDSDKATLELPAEESGIITLKAEDGDTVAVGQVVCLIDTSAKAPEGMEDKKSDSMSSTKEDIITPQSKEETNSYAKGVPSPAAKKIISEFSIFLSFLSLFLSINRKNIVIEAINTDICVIIFFNFSPINVLNIIKIYYKKKIQYYIDKNHLLVI